MNKIVVLFFLIMFVIGTDTFLISPLIPTLQTMFGVRTEVAGWMMGAYTLGSAAFALIAGPLSDGWDRKKVLLTGLSCFAVSTFLCGFATDFWTMCLFRFLAGVSAAFTAPQVWASIPTLFPPAKISKVLGVAYAGLAVSQALGVPIGSLLASGNWSLPFWTIGIFSLLLAAAAYYAVPGMKPQGLQGAKPSIFKRYVPLLTSGTARGTFLAYFFVHLGSSAAFAFLGKWMTDSFHLSVDETGYVIIFLGLGNFLGSLCGPYVFKALSQLQTMTVGMFVVIAAYIALPYVSSVHVVKALFFLIFAILGILFPLMVGLLNSLNPTIRGTISSLATSTMNAATTFGAWMAGMLYSLFHGYSAVGLFTGICLACSLLVFISSGVLSTQREKADSRAESAT
ncbi:MFS transporter [Paenibacillus allorhizosphaerae]|uniref:Transporter AraJ n=1 Tax=Paenibacillus allorhizosphaerae TaxID=2849866 RepID=A0ABM8VA10_9BACL|nr:MFS transporter [Paenibacillus allorhizosphaerae]CAG7615014.1 Putative transporter AraJ [Paenibacillus allorhizosphaerae]